VKRTPLTRKTPLARSAKPLKRTRMTSKLPTKRATATYEECHGVRFPPTRGELRAVKRPSVQDQYRVMFDGEPCALCQQPNWKTGGTELHHLVGGAMRSDEFCNFIMLCRACHSEIQSQPADYPRVWLAKWRVDREHTDWRRLIELLGRVPFTDLD
jgi:hypothetical protein